MTSVVVDIEKEEQYRDFLVTTKKPLVVIYGAEWCGPCRMMKPKLSKLAKDLNDQAVFIKVDTEVMEDLAVKCGVSSVPFFRIYIEDKLKAEMSGSKWEKIEEFIREHTIVLPLSAATLA